MASNPESFRPFFQPEQGILHPVVSERGDPPERLLEEHPEVLELPPFKEEWVPTFNVFTISGHPGSGKTLQAMALAHCYNIELVTPSQKFREEIEEMGQQVQKGVIRPEKMDRELDKKQRKDIEKACESEESIILESRLGAVISTEYMLEVEKKQKREKSIPSPKIIRGLWVANREVRARRVAERDDTKIEQAKKDTTDREKVDFERWRSQHPILKKVKDVFDPTLVYNPRLKSGNRLHDQKGKIYLYDFSINTSKDTFIDSFLKAHDILVRTGGIIRLDDYKEQYEGDSDEFNPHGGDIANFA